MRLRFSIDLCLMLGMFFITSTISTGKSQAAGSDLHSLGLNLVGVLAFEEKPRAMISMAGIDEDMLIGEGDLVEGYTVRRIEKTYLELSRDGQIEKLAMENANSTEPSEPATIAYAESGALEPAGTAATVRRLASSRSLKRVLARAPTPSSPIRMASLSTGGRPRFIRPINVGYVSSGFGYRIHPTTRSSVGGTYSMHRGTDIAAPTGSPILAAADGVVGVSAWTWAKGNYIEIKHSGGYGTSYFHMTRRNVQAGQLVSAGQIIGFVGSTGISSGPHLHFEISINGAAVNPANYVLSLNTR